MTHFYERNIVEIKNLYTTFLVNIITPLIYEGVKSVYNNALVIENKFIEKGKNDPNVENPGILKIFQLCLKDIPTLNQYEIDSETSRIKEKSKCSEWFDDLIKAVVKSHIILLTYNASGKTCKTVKDKHHELIKTSDFIHKCYIESARIFYNYPEIFYHKYSTLDTKRNQREAQELIKTSINEAIKKMLPIKLILQEYLSNDYLRDIEENIDNHMTESQYTNMGNLVKRDLGRDVEDGKIVNVFDDGSKHSTIVETTDNLDDNNELNQKQDQLNKEISNISNENKLINDSDKKSNDITSVDNKTSVDNLKEDDIVYVKKPIKEKGGNDFFKNLTVPIKPNNELPQNNSLNEIKYSNKINDDSDDMNINIVRSVKDNNYSALFDDYMN
jgi:hypothetical protein